MQFPTRRFLMRIYTGPCAVGQYAQRFRDAGYTVSCEGTEHIHVWCPDLHDGWGAVTAVKVAIRMAGMPVDWWTQPESRLLQTDNGTSPAGWNRYDICEAWYLFASDWHEGQFSDTYAIFGRLDRLGFRPSPLLSTASLSPNGRLILAGLIRSARASRRVS